MHRMNTYILGTIFLFTTSVFATPQIKIIAEKADSLTLELSLDPVKASSRLIRVTPYTELTISGLTNVAEEGAPLLPLFSRYLAIPAGKVGVILDTTVTEVPVKIQHEIAFFDGVRGHCRVPRELIHRDPKAYSAAGKQPIVSLSPVSYIGPIRTSLLRVRPVRLTSDPKTVLVTQKLVVKIGFHSSKKKTKAPVSHLRLTQKQQTFYQELVLNANALPSFGRARQKDIDLLLVHEDYKYELPLMQFLQFKAELGRETRVHYFSSPSKNELKSFIKSQYAAPAPPTHTLLIGSIDQLPSFRRNSFWSDYAYSLLDSGSLPDISIGRLPVRNGSELKKVIDKIKTRKHAPRDDGAFLVTSGYETGWCQKNLKFIMDNNFAHSEIPIQVTKLYASEGKKTDAVVNGYNSNPNIIVYDGHGDASGMTEIPLKIQHMPRLQNTVYPLLFDIACLNSYWTSSGASSANFAHSISTLLDAGVAGIVASSYYSGGHDFFRYMFRAAIHDDKSPNNPYHHINEMGTIVQYGKLKYLEQFGASGGALNDNYMFYFHGDPASTLFRE